jgi:hypothetical protein
MGIWRLTIFLVLTFHHVFPINPGIGYTETGTKNIPSIYFGKNKKKTLVIFYISSFPASMPKEDPKKRFFP